MVFIIYIMLYKIGQVPSLPLGKIQIYVPDLVLFSYSVELLYMQCSVFSLAPS